MMKVMFLIGKQDGCVHNKTKHNHNLFKASNAVFFLMADYRDKIMALAQNKPLLPNDVAKELNTNLIMASAMLSELSSNKKLRVSKLKIGSSPLYFIPEKEAQLEGYVGSLNEKDRKTVEILKNSKILRDKELDPLTRVSLRQINDFSRQIEVKNNGESELFWKWYLLPDSDAEFLIRQVLEPAKVVSQKQQIVEQVSTPVLAKLEPAPIQAQNFLAQKQVSSFSQENVAVKKEEKKAASNIFFSKIISFFEESKIKIIENTELKKSAEYDFVIEVPSPLGALTYYCKARNKKKISDADISNVFVQGQLKKLPSLLITQGELHKNAKELLQQLKGVSFQKI